MEGGFPPGLVLLDKYRVEGELGRGGMGVVLRVTHLHLGEELAIKILLPQMGGGLEVHARFLREAQSAVRLRGEHVARVGDVGVFPGGAPYMVMEYLRGGDLSGELARRGTLPPGEIVDYVLQACEALAEAHALGIVHRDIKPSNLFLTRRPDGSPLVKVLDFGISKAPIGGPGVLTRTDTVMGTPGYMSPEQMKASKDVDARSDIWALGIVLYECVNGRRPFDAETFSATVLRAATEPPPPMAPRISRGLQAVILRCLEKDRSARFASTAALAAALAPFARDARSAGIIVDRTTAMLQGPGASVAQGPRFDQPPYATTLSGSAGMMRVRSTRRYAIGGVVVLGVIVALLLVGLMTPREGHETIGFAGSGTVLKVPGGVPGVPTTSASGATVAYDAASAPDATEVTVAHDAGSVPDATYTAEMGEATATPAVPHSAAVARARSKNAVVDAKVVVDANAVARVKPAVDAKTKMCAEFEVSQKWQDLRDCAGELAELAEHDQGATTKAEAFRAKAVTEMRSSVASDKLKEAIAGANLRGAQILLKSIGVDSVYYSAAGKMFRAAEADAIDESRRKAEVLVGLNDCMGVNRLRAQINATGTAAVSYAVAVVAAKCVERPVLPPGAPQDPSHPAAADQTPVPPRPSECEAFSTDEILAQAQNQYAAGFASAALKLATKALLCKQDIRMYRYAATYACAAHDATAAKQFMSKVPLQFQGAIVQRCQQEGILLRGP